MIDVNLIKSKVNDILGYLDELRPVLREEARAIIDNNLKLRTVERLFQLIVDTAVDINTHIIIESGFHVPDDYQSTFVVLADKGIVSKEFALKIAPSVGLRNLVVHKYGKVDIKKMVDDIKAEIGQYEEHLGYINDFLKKQSS